MRVLGIDPGLATMGYGIIDVEGNRLRAVEYGTIETASKTDYPKRLYQLHVELKKNHRRDTARRGGHGGVVF